VEPLSLGRRDEVHGKAGYRREQVRQGRHGHDS
jgi:hypothetical protein